MQHRVVMEQVLVVNLIIGQEFATNHGKRDDNRPENLELWAKHQPPGQRIEDLIEHAKMILKTYEPIQKALGGK